jgi:hypothetical protein
MTDLHIPYTVAPNPNPPATGRQRGSHSSLESPTGEQMMVLEALVQLNAAEVDFDPPRAEVLYRPADLS